MENLLLLCLKEKGFFFLFTRVNIQKKMCIRNKQAENVCLYIESIIKKNIYLYPINRIVDRYLPIAKKG